MPQSGLLSKANFGSIYMLSGLHLHIISIDSLKVELGFKNRIRFSRFHLPKPVMNIKIQLIGF